jgi:DNA repair exonuclease SbcCD ATPase subunit
MLRTNLKRQITVTTVTSLFVLLSTTPVFALVSTARNTRTNAANSMGIMKSDMAMSPAVSGTVSATKMDNLKLRASNEIDRRINSLNQLLDRVNALKRLTADQKSGFVNELQSQISTLGSLKTKINADTDMTTLRTDVQSVITAYRIYALFIPQMHILSADDILTTTSSEFAAFAGKLQTRIDQMKSEGMDTSALQALMTDIQKKLADANTQLQNVVTTVVGLTPSGYPGNKSSLQSARSMLQTAHTDLETARADALKIMADILAMKAPSGVMSPMPSGTMKMNSTSAGQ